MVSRLIRFLSWWCRHCRPTTEALSRRSTHSRSCPALGGAPTADHLAISALPISVKLHKDLPPTGVWSYRLEKGKVIRKGTGVSYLGPTIEVQRAQKVTVAWKNEIS